MTEDQEREPNATSGGERPPGITRRGFFDPNNWHPLVEGLARGLKGEGGGAAASESSVPAAPEAPVGMAPEEDLPVGMAPPVGRRLEVPEEAEMREELQRQEAGFTRRQLLRNSGILGTAFVVGAFLTDFRFHWVDQFLKWRRSSQERERRPNQVVKAWASLLLNQEGLERGALASLKTFARKYHDQPRGIDRYEIWEKSGLWGLFGMPLKEEMAVVEQRFFQPLLEGNKDPILASWGYRQITSRTEIQQAVEELFSFFKTLPGEPTSADIFAYLVTVKGYDPAKVMAVRLAVEKYETKGKSETGRRLDTHNYLTSLETEIRRVDEGVLSAESGVAEVRIKGYLRSRGYSADEVEIVYQAAAIMRNRQGALSVVIAELTDFAREYEARESEEALSFDELSQFLTTRGYSAEETKKLRLAFAVLTDTVSLQELLLSLS